MAMLSSGSRVSAASRSRTVAECSLGAIACGEQVEREQHQPEADRDAAEVLHSACPRPRRKASTPAAISTGKTSVDVEGEHLHDQRRADIGAEHHGERRHKLDRAERR